MRVTNGMMQNTVMSGLSSNMQSLDELFYQMTTLKKIQTPSDDPIIAGRALKLRVDVSELEQYETNVSQAMSWLEVTDSAMTNMNSILLEVRTRLNQAANDTLTESEREKILTDIQQLAEQLKQEGNTSYAGRYVFSGYKTDQPVYLEKDTEMTNDVVTGADFYLSDDMTVSAQTTIGDTTYAAGSTIPAGTLIPEGTTITAGTVVPSGTANPEVFGHTDGQDIAYQIGTGTSLAVNQTGVTDFLSNFENVLAEIIEAVENDDVEKLSSLIGDIDEVSDELSSLSADVGSRQTRLEFTSARITDNKITFTELLSQTEDVDIEEVYIKFNAQMMVYQSALQASSRVIVNTLADYL